MKTIAVFTGTRAEYGLLYWLIKDIERDPELELQLIVSGMHLSAEFGNTWKTIEHDGFQITKKIEMLMSSDSPVGIVKSIGVGTLSYADALEDLNPECLVVLGDRFEALAIAQTAMVMRIPIAHIHGGEVTEGVIDDAIRHAITKMAHLHFTSTEVYRKRVIQLGEHPDRVLNTGALAIENMRRMTFISRRELEESLSIKLDRQILLVTYHPVTLSENGNRQALVNLIEALEEFVGQETAVVMTYPNADTHSRALLPILRSFEERHPDSVLLSKSLGQLQYLSLMKLSSAVVGNSSSGLLEAPAFKRPTVNIGDRQKGRIRTRSVLDSGESTNEIICAIERALSVEFQSQCANVKTPYGDGKVSEVIISVLKRSKARDLIPKAFFDLSVNY